MVSAVLILMIALSRTVTTQATFTEKQMDGEIHKKLMSVVYVDGMQGTSENVTTLVENLAEQNDVVIYVYETGSSLIKPLYSTDKSYMRILKAPNL